MMKISTDSPAFRVRPAQPEEAGAFFAQTPEQYAQMGAIGCVSHQNNGLHPNKNIITDFCNSSLSWHTMIFRT